MTEEKEKETTTQMALGTWTNLITQAPFEKQEQVKFAIGSKEIIKFLDDEPTEMESDTGAYYIFKVNHNNTDKIIMTSAWTLLRGLSQHNPLKNKVLLITKVLIKGKQTFLVEEVI